MPRPHRDQFEVLALDPRDPDIVRAKRSPYRSRASRPKGELPDGRPQTRDRSRRVRQADGRGTGDLPPVGAQSDIEAAVSPAHV